MYTTIETPVFQRQAHSLWSEDEREDFIGFISNNPLAGEVIPGTGNLRKVRWAREGMGKRGGARVIYYNRLASGEIVLLTVYAKTKFEDLPTEFLLQLKERFNDRQD